MRGRVRFIGVVFATYVLLFAVQKPLYLLNGSGAWAELGPGEWLLAALSGLFFDMALAAGLSIVPAVFAGLYSRLPEQAAVVFLRGYFLLSSLGIAAVFAFAGWPSGNPVLQLSVFILFAASSAALFWERILPLLGRDGRAGRRYAMAATISLLLLLPVCGGVLAVKSGDRIYDPASRELYHLAVNPYYELVGSLHGASRRD